MLIKIIFTLTLYLSTTVANGGDRHREPVPATSPSPSALSSTGADEKKIRCQQAWEKYRESQACFAPYILASGGIKAEAFKHCTEVRQPDFCD